MVKVRRKVIMGFPVLLNIKVKQRHYQEKSYFTLPSQISNTKKKQKKTKL